ncbi:MAG: choice-of-anchor X domain-containing protein [Acidobacteriota bacterium]
MWLGKRIAISLGMYTLAACSGAPTTPSTPLPSSPPTVGDALVLVGGLPVQATVAQGTDEPALFRVRVQAPGGLSTIRRVVLEYTQPGQNHGAPMMGGFSGSVLCYDDGTHGDDVPGDGIYHYMDGEDQIGCHGIEAPRGEYHYSFWCEDVYGQRSNTASVTVVRQ